MNILKKVLQDLEEALAPVVGLKTKEYIDTLEKSGEGEHAVLRKLELQGQRRERAAKVLARLTRGKEDVVKDFQTSNLNKKIEDENKLRAFKKEMLRRGHSGKHVERELGKLRFQMDNERTARFSPEAAEQHWMKHSLPGLEARVGGLPADKRKGTAERLISKSILAKKLGQIAAGKDRIDWENTDPEKDRRDQLSGKAPAPAPATPSSPSTPKKSVLSDEAWETKIKQQRIKTHFALHRAGYNPDDFIPEQGSATHSEYYTHLLSVYDTARGHRKAQANKNIQDAMKEHQRKADEFKSNVITDATRKAAGE